IAALGAVPQSRLVRHSAFYRTAPMGPAGQPDYLNAAVLLETDLTPHQLLDATQAIELAHGRIRKDERWGPRTLDLDIMLFGDMVISDARLTVPHYGLKVREFMLYPLAEIAPGLILPDGEPLAAVVARTPENGLGLWSSSEPVR
ncbi:2-amino-4-hydroxy-6-hydroxymethyldihydropteridine diphosphokinase, partial [Salmonella enterica subsp. enterica serovar Bareilly]|nr:2-amino-4-hydroxy-6-hydroxymethyldihydropteridine diphosphokinase [Salmonella enterica subsp. enterica serovar Bareilly]